MIVKKHIQSFNEHGENLNISDVRQRDIEIKNLEKSILTSKEDLERFDDNFEKGFIKMHIHDYNHMRKNLVDELLLAKQRLSDFKNSKG